MKNQLRETAEECEIGDFVLDDNAKQWAEVDGNSVSIERDGQDSVMFTRTGFMAHGLEGMQNGWRRIDPKAGKGGKGA